jgi:outer membrane protein assembly factor BamD (BamD/ComL family)
VNRDSIFSWIKNPKPEDSLLVAQFDSMMTNRTFDPNAKQKLEQQRRQREALTSQLTASLPDTLKFKNDPPRRSKISEDSLKTLIAKNQLDLGNLFLSEFDMPDSAYKYYNSNLTEYSENSYYAASLFAMGSYYLTVDNKESADSLFTIVYDNYKNESIVNAAAIQLGEPLIDLNYDPALEKYSDAEKLIFEGQYSSALYQLEKIPKEFPKSEIAPKAIYASGWVEENALNDPGAAVEYYDTLIARYPASEYVKIIAPKVSLYKQEMRKRELALKDSLQHLAVVDTLGTDTTFVTRDEITSKDSAQVAVIEEEQKPVQQEEKPPNEPQRTPVIKEPVWNPRIRK